jgi:hypothetical protein
MAKEEDDPLGFDKFAKRIDEMNDEDSPKPPGLPPETTTEKRQNRKRRGKTKAWRKRFRAHSVEGAARLAIQ